MGQYEEPLPKVRRARFSRREQARLDAVAQLAKLSGDFPQSQGDVALDVLEEDPAGPDLVNDPGNLGPEVARILPSSPVTGLAEGLTGITGSEDMNAAAPRAAVEGSQIVPDRRRSQGFVAHPRHESGRGVSFPLDVTNSAISGLGDMQAEVQPGIAGAQGEAAKVIADGGMKSHKARSLRPLVWRSGEGSRASRCSGRHSDGT